MIYLIAYQTDEDDDRRTITTTIDEDHGYFTDPGAAQDLVDKIDREPRERYLERKADYDKKLARWEHKQARARAHGFANPDPRPSWPPQEPLPHLVVPLELNSADPTNDKNNEA